MSILAAILNLDIRARLRKEGSSLMGHYDRAVKSLSNEGEYDTVYAEMICPVIRRYRRRAKAIAKFLNKPISK